MSYHRRRDSLEEELKDWDGSTEYFTEAPTRTRIDEDGNFEAVWVTMTTPKTWVDGEEEGDGDYEEDEGADEVIGWLERVVISPDSFLVERYEDVIERYADDPMFNEEGEPYYTEHGEEYMTESVEFDRRRTLLFLTEFLSGKIKRESEKRRTPLSHGKSYTYTEHFWTSIPSTPAARRRPPRNKLELLPWIRSMGDSLFSSGSGGGDYSSYLPEYDW